MILMLERSGRDKESMGLIVEQNIMYNTIQGVKLLSHAGGKQECFMVIAFTIHLYVS